MLLIAQMRYFSRWFWTFFLCLIYQSRTKVLPLHIHSSIFQTLAFSLASDTLLSLNRLHAKILILIFYTINFDSICNGTADLPLVFLILSGYFDFVLYLAVCKISNYLCFNPHSQKKWISSAKQSFLFIFIICS